MSGRYASYWNAFLLQYVFCERKLQRATVLYFLKADQMTSLTETLSEKKSPKIFFLPFENGIFQNAIIELT